MCKRKNRKNKKQESFERMLSDSLYTTVYNTLSEVLETKCETTDADGKKHVDYETTCRIIKTKARVALDFVSTLKQKEVDK